MLLTEPSSNDMYEVEVMLGETDESHIIRTIEYCSLGKQARDPVHECAGRRALPG
jgi:hypothetical protein